MIAVFLAGTAIILFLVSRVVGAEWAKGLSVRVSFAQPYLYAGETGELTEVVENRKKRSVPLLEIGFRVPRGLIFPDTENAVESDYIYRRDLFAAEGMERIVRHCTVRAQRRGHYTVSQVSCHAPSVFFLADYMVEDPQQDKQRGLYVYAANADCGALLQAVEVLLGERQREKRLYEDPFAFASIRPYTVRDPMKTINWKASARTAQLMVNTFSSAADVKTRVFLDVEIDPAVSLGVPLRETAVSVAATLVRFLVRRGQDASLYVNAETQRPPGEKDPSGPEPSSDRLFTGFVSCLGSEHLSRMEEYLTSDFDALRTMPFSELPGAAASDAAYGKQDGVCVFVTADVSGRVRDKLEAFLGREEQGIWVQCVPESQMSAPRRERNLVILPTALR